MKVLHVLDYTSKKRGGMPYALLNIIKLETRNLSIESDVLTQETEDRNLELEETANNVYYFENNGILRGASDAKKWFRDHANDYDVIQFHGLWNRFTLDLFKQAHALKIKFNLWPHCSLDYHDLRKKKTIKFLIGWFYLSWVLKYAKFTLTSELEITNSKFFVRSPVTQVLPLPIPKMEVSKVTGNHDKPFVRIPESFYFLFLSRFDPKKGLQDLLPAFQKLAKENPAVNLILAGADGSEFSNRMIESIKSEIAEGSVQNVGFLDDHAKAYAFQNSDCYLLPSYYENFGISIVEALQHGLPAMITRNVYIHNDLYKHNSIWLTETGSKAIYQVMKEILSNNVDYEEKCRNAATSANQYLPEELSPLFASSYAR